MRIRAEDFWRRFVPAWAVVIVGWYVIALARWIRPTLIAQALPLWGPAGPPLLTAFAAKAAAFAAGLAVALAAGQGAGRPLGRWLRLPGLDSLRAIPLGWAGLAGLWLGLGLAGLWVPAWFVAPVAVAALAGAWGGGRSYRTLPWAQPAPVLLFPAVLIGWIIVLVCLAPEVFQDALRYHLFFPRQFLFLHKFVFEPRDFFWSYMGPVHLLYGAGLCLDGERGARAVNLACALLSLTVLLRLARVAGLADRERALAVGLAVTAPGLVLITGSAFIEHGVALCGLLALLAVMSAGPRTARWREAVLWLAFGFTVKYTVVFSAVGLGVMLGLDREAARWRLAARRTLRGSIAIAAGFVGPWMLLHWLWTRDPLSPLLGRLGWDTLDASSRPALHAFYRFAGDALRGWIARPADLLRYPADFAGAHSGFWEHPGPAIPCLIPAVLWAWPGCRPPVQRLLWFAGGSAGAWGLLCGGISPHYIVALTGLWILALIGALPAVPRPSRLLLAGLLSFVVFFQALVSVVAGVYRWSPRDVVMGGVSESRYRALAIPAPGLFEPVLRELERVAPSHGTVYVYGSDTAYDLAGRIRVDYESGADPLLWRLAAASRDAERLRVKVRQQRWSHAVYTTRWPDLLTDAHDYPFRFDDRTLTVVQTYWARYASLVVTRETEDHGWRVGAYAFALTDRPRPGPAVGEWGLRWPVLPGAEGLAFNADRSLAAGRIDRATAAYRRAMKRAPGCAFLADRMARVALARGRRAEARDWLRREAALGWTSPSLAHALAATGRP